MFEAGQVVSIDGEAAKVVGFVDDLIVVQFEGSDVKNVVYPDWIDGVEAAAETEEASEEAEEVAA